MVADANETVTAAAESVPCADARLVNALRTILPLVSVTLMQGKC
jgi:hypothetical protein